MKKLGVLATAIVLVGSVLLVSACGKATTSVSGSYSAYLEGYDWGKNISRVTLKLNHSIDSKTISKGDFTVSVSTVVGDL